MAITSKSPTAVLRMALQVAEASIPRYAHRFSPKKFTQHQLFACLVLKDFLQADYRGVTTMLDECSDLRQAIDLQRVPHFSTLQQAAKRLLREPLAEKLLRGTLDTAREQKQLANRIDLAAIDASGFETHHTSRYFVRRRNKPTNTGKRRPSTSCRRFPKMAVLADCRSHLVLAVHFERGPGPDITHLKTLLAKPLQQLRITTLAADAGYDAEWVHELLRRQYGLRVLIPAQIGRPTSKAPSGRYRCWMFFHLHQTRYGQRWQVETVFSMIKRRLGDTLRAHTFWSQRRAALLKVLAHNILILWHIELLDRATYA